MPDYREIQAIQKDPARARMIAQELSGLKDVAWTDWELDFLENLSGWREELSTRQGEKLVELRDETVWYTSVDGFSLKRLVDRCYLCRDDLGESDAAFIEHLKATGTTRMRRKAARRLLRCARAVGEIEPHQGGALSRSADEEHQPA